MTSTRGTCAWEQFTGTGSRRFGSRSTRSFFWGRAIFEPPMNPPAANEKFCQPGKIFSLWLIVLGPAVLWLAQFQVIYTLVAWACKTGRHGVIPATSIFSFLLAAGLGWLSFSRWRETSQPPAADPAH